DEEGWAQYEAELRHWVMHRPIELPDVPRGGYTGGLERRRHNVSLRGREVKVVVGVEDVRLEPGGPAYAGSQWHVEGMRNERIVAVGEYYAEIENITQPTLSFRMATTYPRRFAAGDNGATLRTWGLRDGDACHQHIGTRPLTPGLLLAFPNLYQSSLSPFALADPTRPGRLTLVRFGLVDPEVGGVVCTGDVAPQQEAWIREAVYEALCGSGRVPREIGDMVMERVEGLVGEDEARECARRLREGFVGVDVFERAFSGQASEGDLAQARDPRQGSTWTTSRTSPIPGKGEVIKLKPFTDLTLKLVDAQYHLISSHLNQLDWIDVLGRSHLTVEIRLMTQTLSTSAYVGRRWLVDEGWPGLPSLGPAAPTLDVLDLEAPGLLPSSGLDPKSIWQP
ncbi:hypothetical protein E4T56_gene10370, partial [Termitomyces sp. T112]